MSAAAPLRVRVRSFAARLCLTAALFAAAAAAQSGTWSTKASMPTARFGPATGVINGELYVVSGVAGPVTVTANEAYNPTTDTWSIKAPIPVGVGYAGGAVIGNKLYVVGGCGGGNADCGVALGSALQVYDAATNSWESKASMPTARRDVLIAAIGGLLYVAGGEVAGNGATPVLEVYDPATDMWTTKAPMSSGRCCWQGAVVGGKLYAVGLTCCSGPFNFTMDIYDPQTDVWTPAAPSPAPGRESFGVGEAGGIIYVVSGDALPAGFPPVNNVDAYDPATNSWSTVAPIPTSRGGSRPQGINGVLYVAGAGENPRTIDTLEAFTAGGGGSARTARVSVDSSGGQANSFSGFGVSLSADGRYVVFGSAASNLTAGGTVSLSNIFIHDRKTGVTQLVSMGLDGTPGNGDSFYGRVSADGRYVSFSSRAGNLVPGGANGVANSYIRDCLLGTTRRVSVDANGAPANGDCLSTAVSAGGRQVAFQSAAGNLVPGDTHGVTNCYVHDCRTGVTSCVSVSSTGTRGNGDSTSPILSSDGRFVVFGSDANNLVPNDTNGQADIFVRDLLMGVTTRVSVNSAGGQGEGGPFGGVNGLISAHGRFVTFYSGDPNLVPNDTNGISDVFEHDMLTGATILVSVSSSGAQGNSYSSEPSVSEDGRYVSFYSATDNFFVGDSNGVADVFVRDTWTGTTILASANDAGQQGDGSSSETFISDNGRTVVFESYADNLVPGDTNGQPDVYVRDLFPNEPSAPVAEAGGDQAVTAGDLVALEGSGSYDSNWDALTYQWTQIAGPPVTLDHPLSATPNFTAPNVGGGGATLTFRLIVNDGTFASAAATVNVFVGEQQASSPPTANAGPNQSIHEGQVVHLDGSASFDDDTPSSALAYAWTLISAPAGSGAMLIGATTPTPTFTADRAGSFVAQLIVTDGDGLSSSPATVMVASTNVAPTANAGPDQGAVVGNLVTLDGTGSSDPESDFLHYGWVMTARPAGSAAALVGESTAHPAFVPDVPGTYVIGLMVTDGFVFSSVDAVSVFVISGQQFAVNTTTAAMNAVAALPPSAVTTAGNQKALGQLLGQAIQRLNSGNIANARTLLDQARSRTDGCALHGSPDAQGPSRDWVTDCPAQLVLYAQLTAALNALGS